MGNAADGRCALSRCSHGDKLLPEKQERILLANFKLLVAVITLKMADFIQLVPCFWPNDFGLYCMAGNVAELTLLFTMRVLTTSNTT